MDQFTDVWVLDFEFRCPDGDLPEPRCMVARSFRSGKTLRMWLLGAHHACPFLPTDLLVAFYASAEAGCFLSLGWQPPHHVLDLFPEFKNYMKGKTPFQGHSLLGAATHFGIKSTTTTEAKDEFRALAQKESFTDLERSQLLEYCQQDVETTVKLLHVMQSRIPCLPQALLRGRYMVAAASVERLGIPIDIEALGLLKENWVKIKQDLVRSVDSDFGVYEGGVFKSARWMDYCNRNGIAWPLLESGKPDLKDETFRAMVKLHPRINPIKELRATLDQMKLNDLRVGKDGRNRYLLSAFGSVTSRNQPSNTKAIFGNATWLRHLIRPTEGKALAYIDYEQQEFGIAAALSGDQKMMAAYSSGDPYLTFAKQAGAVPPDATKKTHPRERELYKATALAVQYGMGAKALGERIGQSEHHGSALLRHHKSAYPAFWKWSDAAETHGMLGIPLETVFGWFTLGKNVPKALTFRNFPAQANGAEMLRVAIIALIQAGIGVCAPVHDAVLIEGPAGEIEQIVRRARLIMEEASRVILGGFTIRTDAKIVRYPERYSDPRGADMWERIVRLIQRNSESCDAQKMT
jgi:hypothetical protein